MENLPFEMKYIIMSNLYKCAKDRKYILNKETKKIYDHITKDCDRIFILRKNLCRRCEEDKIIRARMIINNLLPG